MRRLFGITLIGLLSTAFFWSRTPSLQTAPSPEGGEHMVWREYPVGGLTLVKGTHTVVLPDGTYIVIPHLSTVRQEDWWRDSLKVVDTHRLPGV